MYLYAWDPLYINLITLLYDSDREVFEHDWLRSVSMFDKFHLTFSFKSKVSRDVLKNKIEC